MYVVSPILFLKTEHGRELTLSFTYIHLNLMDKQEREAQKNSEYPGHGYRNPQA